MNIREEEDITQYIDSTYLKTGEQADISDEENHNVVISTIQEAIDNNFKLVMIRPEFVSIAREMIDGENSNVLIGTVIGFPHGDNSLGEKLDEAMQAIQDGVDELDFVVDYKSFQKGDLDTIWKEVAEGTLIGIDEGKVVKWIIESAALTNEKIAELTRLISEIVVEVVGPEKAKNVFVKTSTGFYQANDDRPIGATPEAVSIMKSNAGPLQVKASGGIHSRQDLDNMVRAGATRVGTSKAYDIYKGNEGDSSGY